MSGCLDMLVGVCLVSGCTEFGFGGLAGWLGGCLRLLGLCMADLGFCVGFH